jgi:isopenicillin-N N-acyltransferase-like protein
MSTSSPFAVIRVQGPPRERGLQYGAQCEAAIHGILAAYRGTFKQDLNLEWNDASRIALDFLPAIEGYNPQILEEMRGIAEGAHITFEDILTLNVKPELAWLATSGGLAGRQVAATEGCTALVALPEATANKHMLVAQNYDWYLPVHDFLIILDRRRTEAPNCVTFAEVGMFGKSGLTSAGIGLIGNALISDKMRSGVPTQVLVEKMTRADNLAEAVGMLLNANRGASMNRIVADAEGQAIDIEAAPKDYNVVFPDDGILVHTNHFTISNHNIRDLGPQVFPSSLTRYQRARQLLSTHRGHVSVDAMQSILRDHLGKPNSICWHGDGRLDKARQIQTALSVVMDLSDKKWYIAKGPPCQNEYMVLDLSVMLSNAAA